MEEFKEYAAKSNNVSNNRVISYVAQVKRHILNNPYLSLMLLSNTTLTLHLVEEGIIRNV